MMKLLPQIQIERLLNPSSPRLKPHLLLLFGMSLGNSSATVQSFSQNGNLGKGQGNRLQARVGRETCHKAMCVWLLHKGSPKRKVIVFPWRQTLLFFCFCFWIFSYSFGCSMRGLSCSTVHWNPNPRAMYCKAYSQPLDRQDLRKLPLVTGLWEDRPG